MTKLLNIFSNKKPKPLKLPTITIDHREKNSLVPSYLKELDFKLEFKHLPVADYLVKETAIERKTISDFKSSIINKRIISQLLELKQYPQPILILEGINSKIYQGTLHENAFRGFLLSVLTEYNIPIIFTLNEKDTAKYISVLAKKSKKPHHSIRPSKLIRDNKEQLQFILEGFPGIGPATAKTLLKKFKTLKSLANAPKEQLKELIGKKGEALYELLNKSY